MPRFDVLFNKIVSVTVDAPDEDAARDEAISVLKWTDLANGDGTGIFFLRNYDDVEVTAATMGDDDDDEEDSNGDDSDGGWRSDDAVRVD